MRKLLWFNMMTLDGFFAGPNREIDWHHVDAEFNIFAVEQLEAAGILLFGRITYEMMADYWPSDFALSDDPATSALMNSMEKIVFSKNLKTAGWNNTRLIKDNLIQSINMLKQATGDDLLLLGSADLASQLIEADLIDEYRIMINPIVLGAGMPNFKNLKIKKALELLNSRVFKNGNVLLTYQPVKNF